MERSSKPDERLQNKQFSFMAESLPPYSLSINNSASEVCVHSDFTMALSFAIFGSIATTAIKFMPKRKKARNLFLKMEELINFTLVWNKIQR